jgi:hypothetical protein
MASFQLLHQKKHPLLKCVFTIIYTYSYEKHQTKNPVVDLSNTYDRHGSLQVKRN